MFLLVRSGHHFGISKSFETLCTIGGAGKFSDYLNVNWKDRSWLLMFVLGTIIGGYLAGQVFPNPDPIAISDATIQDLAELGFNAPSGALIPIELFNWNALGTTAGLITIVLGGFLIGFGTRWAGGCTSGHAITGLSSFQLTSLIAVIGFFAGGLFITHFIFPYLYNL
jgi:uncharacterized membrane protein YedE/YeeE